MSESDVYGHQILTSKVHPRTERIKVCDMAVDHSIGIEMKRKELTKTCMIISNKKSIGHVGAWAPSNLAHCNNCLNYEKNMFFKPDIYYRVHR